MTTDEFKADAQKLLSPLCDIRFKNMMGEYIVYYRGRIAAYLCDDRFLIKPVPSAAKYLGYEIFDIPYPGAKPMLLLKKPYSSELLCGLFEAIFKELPVPEKKN